jgi:hypothetical protein
MRLPLFLRISISYYLSDDLESFEILIRVPVESSDTALNVWPYCKNSLDS